MEQALLFDIPPIPTQKKPQTLRFYDAIKREYLRMRNVKKNNVRLYSDEYILATVADKFYRSPRTIENIVFDRC